MKASFLKWPIMVLAALMVFVTSCGNDDDNDDNQPAPTSKTIAETVESDARYSILHDALVRASLTSVLDDESASLTVFAPDNAAFQALLTDLGYADLDELETALTTAGLRNVLLYHVLGQKVTASMVSTSYATTEATNPDGDKLSLFTNTSGGVSLNSNVAVKDADIMASNGVIHGIEGVLLPLNIVELAALNTATFSSLVAALGAADGDLVNVLSDPNATFTVFAPSDDAFNDLLQATNSADLNELITNLGGPAALRDVLLYHVVSGNVRAEDLSSGSVPTALSNESLMVDVGTEVTITDGQMGMSTVTQTNIQGTNGVIHQISAVLVP